MLNWFTHDAAAPRPAFAAGGQGVHETVGTDNVVRVFVEMKRDDDKARSAFERLKARSLTLRPNPRNGATAAIRRLRDGG